MVRPPLVESGLKAKIQETEVRSQNGEGETMSFSDFQSGIAKRGSCV
jgi:hypothetical protein